MFAMAGMPLQNLTPQGSPHSRPPQGGSPQGGSSQSSNRTQAAPPTGVHALHVDGYYTFSKFIASDPLRTTTIFRRFDVLAIRNLLYLESELAELEKELRELDEVRVPEAMINPLSDWKLLYAEVACAEDHIRPSKEEAELQERMVARRDLILRIRSKVKEYRKPSRNYSLRVIYEI